MPTWTVLLCTGVGSSVAGYAAGRLRPLHQLDRGLDTADRWAQRQLAWPRPNGRRGSIWLAHVTIWAIFLMQVCVAPRVMLQQVRKAHAIRAYSQALPEAVKQAAVEAVAAHRSRDADRFHALVVPVYSSGRHDLSNVALISREVHRVYLGLGNPSSTGLAAPLDPAMLSSTTCALDEALTALRPPAGSLLIPLTHH